MEGIFHFCCISYLHMKQNFFMNLFVLNLITVSLAAHRFFVCRLSLRVTVIELYLFVIRFRIVILKNHIPQCRAQRLTEDVWHQKYGNKKEGFQRYLKCSFNTILNIIPRSRYRVLDLNLATIGNNPDPQH